MHQSLTESDKFSHYLDADIGSFRLALHDYLRDDVAKIIRTDGSWSVGSILHPEVAKSIVNNVMWWLFDGEPEKSLLELEQLNNPQHICGRVFKSGEPTYSCRDCAMDPTCVFCQHCFWKSEHQKHRFKMHTSGGGGCCDCGDAEAWHKFPACHIHAHDQDSTATQDAVSRLPLKIRERAPHFFEVILSYIVDFLTNEKTSLSDLDDSLQPSEKSDSFVTMLFNDELHTFDFVIDILRKALKCDDALGADFATVVDREGRSAVCIDNEAKCEEVKNIVGMPPTPYFSFRTNEPLKTLIIHTTIVAHQEMALLILPMLARIMKLSEGLRVIFCQVAFKETITAVPPVAGAIGSGKRSPVEQLMRCDHELWKSARNQYLHLLMNSLLLDVETKRSFAVLFTRLYEVMQEGFMKGDHDHSQSVTSLAVQVFTVPTVARHLIIYEDVIGVILRSLLKSCYDSCNLDPDDWCRIIKINMKQMKVAMRRTYYSFFDLRYILAILPSQLNADLKLRIINGTKLIIQMLMAMQGMDEVVRKSDRHIERDPDWETGTTVIMKFYQITNLFLQWIATDTEMLMTALNICLQALNVLNQKAPEVMKLGTTTYSEKTYQCIDYDITKQAVSTQYPVSRFTAAILVELAKTGISWTEIQSNQHVNKMLDDPLIVNQLMEYSIRCLALCAQVNAGMWRRNGLSLINQLIYYKDYRCRVEAFERDIQMLQVCAANMDPSHFIALLLHKMNLSTDQPEFAEYHASILGEFFFILISVCGERFVPGVSEVTFQQQMRRQIIHILATEPKPHSKIVKYLLETVTDRPEWEDTLHEVADFHHPTSTNSVGRYALKSSCLDEFCPYSYHYTSATDETKAQQEISRRKKAQQLSLVHIPPKLPRFTPLLGKAPYILCSDAFIHVISRFLQQLTTGRPEMWTDRLVDKAMYLIAMAITENEQQLEENLDTTFDFARKSITGCESGILFLLKQLEVTESLAVHRDMIRWLVAKIEQLTNRRQGSSSVDPEPSTSTHEQVHENDNSRSRKRKAQERREKLLSQMKMMQQRFLSENQDVLSEQSQESLMDTSQEIVMSHDVEIPVCSELSWQLRAMQLPELSHTCILCQEETTPSQGSIVMSAFVQRSTVLTRGPRETLNTEQYAPLFVDLSFPNGLHTSTCSHTMHYDCFKQFRQSVHNTEANRRHHRYSRRSFDTSGNEFLCPLCSCLSNTVLPIIPLNFVAEQRGVKMNDAQVTERASLPPTLDRTVASMKEWLKSIEEILKPMKSETQEVVLKFHADVSCLDVEMEKAEQAGLQESEVQPLEETLHKLIKAPIAASADARAEGMIGLHTGVQDALDEYLQAAQTIGLNGSVSEVHRSLTSWLAVSTTVMCAEMISRLNKTSILAKSPVRVSAALDGVVRTAFAMQATCTEENLSDVRKYALELLKALVEGDTTDRSLPPVMNCNIFSIFVNLWFSTAVLRRSKLLADHQSLLKTEEFERNLLHLCILAQVVQIFSRLDLEKLSPSDDQASSAETLPEAAALFQAFNQVRSTLNIPATTSVTANQFAAAVKENMLPFIRCCALFLHHVTGVPGPKLLPVQDEYTSMLSYLGLHLNLAELFDVGGKLSLEPLIQKWTTHPKVALEISSIPWHLLYPTLSEVPDIVPFPHDYSDLVGAAASFCCPKFASEDSLCPTMCLVCGVMLCSQSYCCQQFHPEKNQQVGACTFHARNCGAGAGVFLRVREATIVLLNGVHRGCFVQAPYLDRHGETDKGMRRGNPLYLNQSRLLELRKLWLSHGIAEKVSHDIESGSMRHIYDWAHL